MRRSKVQFENMLRSRICRHSSENVKLAIGYISLELRRELRDRETNQGAV